MSLKSMSSNNSIRKSIKYVKQIDTQIEKNVGYSTKHIIIGFITVMVALYVCMKIYRW